MANARELGAKTSVFDEILIKPNYAFSNFSSGDKVEYFKPGCTASTVR